jgi:hypothetical protein
LLGKVNGPFVGGLVANLLERLIGHVLEFGMFVHD